MLSRQSRVRVFGKVNQQHSNPNPLQHRLIAEQENKTTEPNPKTRLSREDRRKAGSTQQWEKYSGKARRNAESR